MSYRKVLRYKFSAICQNCKNEFDLDKKLLEDLEERSLGKENRDLNAKSSSSTVFCLKCGSTELGIHGEYQNLYRRRCPKCREMFETEFSWEEKCEPCRKKHAELMSRMGA